MTDRELLELAAKAAGYRIRVSSRGSFSIDRHGYWVSWNPLRDDGDALRLAVNLSISLRHDEIGMKSFIHVRYTNDDHRHIGLSEIFDDEVERLERTRRAVVRVAAEIGKGL